MKAVLTQAALKDLLEIARHIGKDDIPAARRFTAALRSRAQAVGNKPRLYPFAKGLEATGVRRRLYRDYLIFYRETEAGVEVTRLLHSARNWQSLLAQDEATPSVD
ncbi:MAG TPA: type II toxin-antitoxin system RelE/ParE family toxin [Allosphingosinicella sp.]|nr:type II toxin-antitoxin system RelE/ParE family toxin [Allosphingosinicella sp.]